MSASLADPICPTCGHPMAKGATLREIPAFAAACGILCDEHLEDGRWVVVDARHLHSGYRGHLAAWETERVLGSMSLADVGADEVHVLVVRRPGQSAERKDDSGRREVVYSPLGEFRPMPKPVSECMPPWLRPFGPEPPSFGRVVLGPEVEA